MRILTSQQGLSQRALRFMGSYTTQGPVPEILRGREIPHSIPSYPAKLLTSPGDRLVCFLKKLEKCDSCSKPRL